MLASFQPPASWTARVDAPRAVSSTASPTRPPCEVLRPSSPAAAQAAAKPAVHLVDTETDDGIARFRRGRRLQATDRGRAAADQAPDVGMISGLIRLRAADGDDDVATVGELDVGPAQNRHLAAAQRPVKEQRHDRGVDEAAALGRLGALEAPTGPARPPAGGEHGGALLGGEAAGLTAAGRGRRRPPSGGSPRGPGG